MFTPDTWAASNAPQDFIEQMIKAVVGIEIDVTRIEGKRKLSQRRNAEDRAGVIDGLTREGTDAARAMAEKMRAGQKE